MWAISEAEETRIANQPETAQLANARATGGRREPTLGGRYPCSQWMCYKGRAVKGAAKQEAVPVQREPGDVSMQESSPAEARETKIAGEDASRYCPVCSQRLESRRCKLICPVCGYYMSCADYY